MFGHGIEKRARLRRWRRRWRCAQCELGCELTNVGHDDAPRASSRCVLTRATARGRGMAHARRMRCAHAGVRRVGIQCGDGVRHMSRAHGGAFVLFSWCFVCPHTPARARWCERARDTRLGASNATWCARRRARRGARGRRARCSRVSVR